MARSFPNFETRWIPAPDVLLVPDELYIDPDLRDATRGEDESRRTLAELTATKTGRILQLANEPIPPSPGSEIWAEITEVDEKLHSIFGKVGFWLKGLGGVNEANPWWDVNEEKSKMCSVRRADAASIEQEQRDSHQAALHALRATQSRTAWRNLEKIANEDHELRLVEANAQVRKCTSRSDLRLRRPAPLGLLRFTAGLPPSPQVTLAHTAPLVGGVIDCWPRRPRLEVKALLGAGCYGHAYRAVPVDDSDNEVCIKVFPSKPAATPKLVPLASAACAHSRTRMLLQRPSVRIEGFACVRCRCVSQMEKLQNAAAVKAKCAELAKTDFEVASALESAKLVHKNICSVLYVTPPGKPERITIMNTYPDGKVEPRVHGALHYIEMELGKCELYLYCQASSQTPNQLRAGKLPERFARRIFRFVRLCRPRAGAGPGRSRLRDTWGRAQANARRLQLPA
jgi:hypothetical protein